jgi:hypothetical protein
MPRVRTRLRPVVPYAVALAVVLGAVVLGGRPAVAAPSPTPGSGGGPATASGPFWAGRVAQVQPAAQSRAAQVTVSAPAVTTDQIRTRAESWLTAWNGGPVPYLSSSDPSDWFQGYRRDCSGYVSMVLGLPGPGLVTGQLADSSVSTPITRDTLQFGDLMINPGSGSSGHVVIFDKWADAGHTQYVGYEQSGDGGTHHRTIPYPYFNGYPMSPYRYNHIVPSAVAGSPVVYDPAVGNAEVYLNSQGSVVEDYHTPTGWSVDHALSTGTADTPVALYDPANGNTEVYYNNNGVLYEDYHTPTGWSLNNQLGGTTVTGRPAATYDPANGNTEVYYNSNGRLFELYHTTTGWIGPNQIGTDNQLNGNPAVLYDPVFNNVEVYYNNNGVLSEAYHTPTGWSVDNHIGGGTMTGNPTAIYDPTYNNVEVYFTSANTLTEDYHTATNTWSLGNHIGTAPLTGSPTAIYDPTYNNVEVYFNSTNTLTETYHTTTGWSADHPLGGDTLTGNPVAFYDPANGNTEVYFNSTNTLTEDYHTTTNTWSLGNHIGTYPLTGSLG